MTLLLQREHNLRRRGFITMMRKLILLGTVAALALVSCGESAPQQTTAPEPPGPDDKPMAMMGTTLLPEDRFELPEYDLETFGALIDELRGTPVVVNIWGSWCPPCRVEAPALSEVAHEFLGEVQFLGVDILDSREGARAFIQEFDWPYPHVFDPPGAIRDGLGYIGQPVTFIVDREGEIVFEWNGEVTADQLRTEIRKVI